MTSAEVIRADIRTLKAYQVPASRGMIKLDAMENPYPLPAELREGLAALLAEAPLNRYPDADPAGLKQLLRRSMGIPEAMAITLGNGSDEIIQLLAMAVAKPGATLLAVEPSFAMFRMICTFVGLQYAGVPLRADFSLDLERVLAAIKARQPALILLAYPNNPSGNLFEAAAVRSIVEAAPGLVAVDEAYFAFAGATVLPWLSEHRNLLVIRTVSKLGLAGIRLGFVAGSPAWLSEVEKLRLPYNVNVMTQRVAAYLLERIEVLLRQAETIKQERARLLCALADVRSVTAFPSEANFILMRVTHAERVFDGLKQRGILVKNLNHSHPLLDNCLRVTVGTPDENDRFINALCESLVTA
jgi:histidinol-phosphate aminotransferase